MSPDTLGISGVTRHGRRVRIYSTVDLVGALEQEKAAGEAGRIALSLRNVDRVILDELGYLPFSQAVGVLFFHLPPKLCEHTSVMITTNLTFGEWASVFDDVAITTALRDRLIHNCHTIQTDNASWRVQHGRVAVKSRIQSREKARRAALASEAEVPEPP